MQKEKKNAQNILMKAGFRLSTDDKMAVTNENEIERLKKKKINWNHIAWKYPGHPKIGDA